LVATRDSTAATNSQASADIVTGIAEINEQVRVVALALEDLTAATSASTAADSARDAE
jgi:hypothetical protein